MDPLIFTEIKGILKEDSVYSNITNQHELDNVLSSTTIKRGCCMRLPNDTGKITVKVKIPIPKGIVPQSGSDNEKYNYIDKLVEFDKSLCDSKYVNGTSTCNDFYTAYCSVANSDYMKMSKDQYNLTSWANYAPDCACFGTIPDDTKNIGNLNVNIPGKCYRPSCGTSVSYIDSVSRNNECNLTICNALFNASNISAGHDAGISSAITQNCGQAPIPLTNTNPNTNSNTNTNPITSTDSNSTIPLSSTLNTLSNTNTNSPTIAFDPNSSSTKDPLTFDYPVETINSIVSVTKPVFDSTNILLILLLVGLLSSAYGIYKFSKK
jgi:hypothetical protein